MKNKPLICRLGYHTLFEEYHNEDDVKDFYIKTEKQSRRKCLRCGQIQILRENKNMARYDSVYHCNFIDEGIEPLPYEVYKKIRLFWRWFVASTIIIPITFWLTFNILESEFNNGVYLPGFLLWLVIIIFCLGIFKAENNFEFMY